MAFHTACPFTCRKICFCTLGMPASLRTQQDQNVFVQKAVDLQNLLSNPRLMLGGGAEYVEVLVPRLLNQPKKTLEDQASELADDSGDDGVSRRVGSRRRSTYSLLGVGEGTMKSNHGKRFEAAKYASRQHASREASANGWADRERAGMSTRLDDDFSGEELYQSLVPQVVCGLCGCGEAIGSEKVGRMLSCQACRKQYHRKCTKHWSEHRDLFNWASWVCGSCRNCEVCKRTGDPNKLMFCKRCDQAYHAQCLQPALKHVPKGPFVCPKHVRCTSCSATIPGGGVSSKWFLSYSLCDACGRLFTRGKYCPMCLKVYRDSEPAPMVCCDVCEHWVHCECDGISDEKYQEFQVDDDLRYKCKSCRGECYKVKDLDDASLEIWRRKDVTDAVQIAGFRLAAGLPSLEENLKSYPSSDEDEHEPEIEQVEETPQKVSKKKVKKVTGLTESLTKSSKVPRKGTAKDGSKTKNTPNKSDGTAGKQKNALHPVNSEKIDTSSKKSKKQLASGDGAETVLLGTDPALNLDAEEKDPEHTKSIGSPPGVKIAVELTKLKKKKSDGLKEKGVTTKQKRTSNVDGTDSVEEDTFVDGKGKVKRLNFSNRQENAARRDQVEAPSTSLENTLPQRGGSHITAADKDVKEGLLTKMAKKERALESTSARVDSAAHEEDRARLTSHIEAGASENQNNTQQTEAVRGTSPLHWVGHSDSVRRRRVPSSKYRDMDTSSRQAWTSQDPPLRLNPESGSVQPVSELIPQALESTATLQKTPTTSAAAGARKERRKRPEEVEENTDNDESLDAPRKRLKVADLGENKSDGRFVHSPIASDTPSTRGPIRLKIKKQPGKDTVTPGASKDGKWTEDEEPAVQVHQPSKKKRSAMGQKSGEDPAQKRLAAGDPVGDDTWILQRLGLDAIAKRVEIFWPMDNIWYKGTVVAVVPEKLQFVVHYDDGEKENLNFGEEKVRLLSTTKKA